MVLIAGVPFLYALRWRFCYSDGKPDSFGIWGRAAKKAEFETKQNLLSASIEGRCTRTGKVRLFYCVPGCDYENFQWMGKVVVAGMDNTNEPKKFTPALVGAKIVSRDYIYTVHIDGQSSRTRRTEDEKKIIFNNTGV